MPFCYQFMSRPGGCAAFLSEEAFSFPLDKRTFFAYNEGNDKDGLQAMQEVKKWQEISRENPP